MLEDFIEPVPVADVFVTEIGRIESLGNGIIRTYLCANEEGVQVVKVRLVVPIACAIAMNSVAAAILTAEYRKLNPLKVVI